MKSRGFLKCSGDVHANCLRGFLYSSSDNFCLQTNLKPRLRTYPPPLLLSAVGSSGS